MPRPRRLCQYCHDPLGRFARLLHVYTCRNCAYRLSMGVAPRHPQRRVEAVTICDYDNVPVRNALAEIDVERDRQDAKWGQQNHPDGTGGPGRKDDADKARRECQRQFAEGTGTWLDILDEEVAEAYAESDPAKLRAELIQIAAVATAWIEAIDRRKP